MSLIWLVWKQHDTSNSRGPVPGEEGHGVSKKLEAARGEEWCPVLFFKIFMTLCGGGSPASEELGQWGRK